MNDDDRITATDLAERFKCSKRCIEKWLEKRWLPPRVRAPGMKSPFWFRGALEQFLIAKGICPVSAAYASLHDCTPCMPPIEKLSDADLASRWNVRGETIRHLANATPFPNVLERKPSSIPDEPDTLIFNGDDVRALEKANGNHSGLSKLIQEYELDWDLDQRPDDAAWTPEVEVSGDGE